MQKGKVGKERIAEKLQGIIWRTEILIKRVFSKERKGRKRKHLEGEKFV